MSDSSRGSSGGKRSTAIREALVVAEVALALVLLVGGGLLLRSFVSVLDVELGFRPQDAVAWRVDTNQEFENTDAALAFYRQLVAEVEALPGVDRAGLTDTTPLGRNRSWGFRVRGEVYGEDEGTPTAFPRIVDPGYIPAMEIPLLSGRNLTIDDTPESAPVIVINEQAARDLFGERDPMGEAWLFGGQEWEVVGVVADVRHQSLEEGAGYEMYLPMGQSGWGGLDLVVRSSLPVESLMGPVGVILRRLDPEMPTGDFRTLESVVDRAVSPRRFVLFLLGSFAGAALLLAALGIYGVLSYSVSQRIPEIGIRMAMGESGGQVLARVVGRTVALAAVGITIGGVASFFGTRLITALLFGVTPGDPATFALVTVVLLAVAATAGFLPARRASRTDPMVALRTE